jgi:hypothetical protein
MKLEPTFLMKKEEAENHDRGRLPPIWGMLITL